MPVTAKLSRAFYERLGDDIANELVDWFNAVDLTYRTELRELNELNFARFDAKVGERLAELRSEMDGRFARVDTVLAERLGELRADLQSGFRMELDARFGKVDEQFGKVDERFDKVDDRFTKLEEQIRGAKVSTIRWMFGFWVGTALTVIGWMVAR